MRVLLVGSGGREAALAWAVAKSPTLDRLFIAPGNPGTASFGENVGIAAENIPGLVCWAKAQKIDLVIPGPEAPLALGLTDSLTEAGVACFGPSRAAARLETSKQFTKEICAEAGIPTAQAASFSSTAAAKEYLRSKNAPIVVKADGLAGGKGVVVATDMAEATAAIDAMLTSRIHGDAGASVLIEEYLTGQEISLFAICDGETAVFCGAAQDHKRVGEGDTGPNTGGMGAIAPPPLATASVIDAAMARIIRPALAAMVRRGTPFRGFLFAGLMLSETGPHLIEFNVRFGDPECETLLPLLRTDILPVLADAAAGKLDRNVTLSWQDCASATVILAAKGYPGHYPRNVPINLGSSERLPGVTVFHAGTQKGEDGLVSSGGRVLAVNAVGNSLESAVERAYAAVDSIDFPDGFCRRDIGAKALLTRV